MFMHQYIKTKTLHLKTYFYLHSHFMTKCDLKKLKKEQEGQNFYFV